MTFEVSPNFRDPDGDTLTYAVTSSDAGVVRAEASGAEVTLFPVSTGTATITVTATDPRGAPRGADLPGDGGVVGQPRRPRQWAGFLT